MISVITGDITNSRGEPNAQKWIAPLKKVLSMHGKMPKAWEIFRGDSFQVEVKKPEESLYTAICIKASIKALKELDVRMAIGIGAKTYDASRITESNGEAFINSGETFEGLKKEKRTLALKTSWLETDREFNLILDLASIVMDNWTPSSAEVMLLSLQHKDISQKDLAKKLKITQSSISERQTRAHYSEIVETEHFFREKIKKQIG